MKLFLPLFLFLTVAPVSALAASTFDSVVVEGACTISGQNASTVPYLDSGKNLTSSSVTPTELGFLSGVSSAIQTQINTKASTSYVDSAVAGATIPDATTLVKGKVKLAGDLGGTADLPTVPGLSSKEPSITAGTTSQYWRGDKSFQTLDKSAVGLSNVDNTSDASKPISTATQTALDLKYNASNPSSYITSAGAPVQSVAGKTGTVSLVKGDVGLGNVDNTSDAAKPVSTATQTALDAKEASISSGTTAQYWRGDKSFQTLNTTAVTEGANLYYLFSRVQTSVASAMAVQEMWVTKDNGNDSNDGSLFKPLKTIQAAINVANLISAYYKPVVIHVAPSFGGTGSSYNENITFSQQGVNLVCDNPQPSARSCQISGTITVNLSGTSGGANYVAASNEAYINGFVIGVNNSSATLTFSGSTYQRFILINCYIDQNGTGNAVVMSNSGTSSGSPSLLKVFDSDNNNSNATNPTVDLQAGRLWIYGTTSTISNGNASGPSVTQSGATSSFIANLVQLTGQYNLTSNTATATFNLSTIASGTNPCVVTPSSPNTGYVLWSYAGCNSSNANAFTGTGVVAFATGNACIGTACSTASTVTTTSLGKMPEGGVFLTGSSGALTSLSTNEIIGYGKTVRAFKIENMVGAAAVFTTCTVNPAITLYDCGTSAGACTSGRTALASVTLTAANTGTNGSVTSSTLAAGHYWAMEISAGTCAALNANVTAEGANQ